MNLKDKKYTQFALCREMMEIVDVVRGSTRTARGGVVAPIRPRLASC